MSGMFMRSIMLVRNEWRGLSGRVTWESFLEALGECFGWFLVRVFDQREFSHVHPNKRA